LGSILIKLKDDIKSPRLRRTSRLTLSAGRKKNILKRIPLRANPLSRFSMNFANGNTKVMKQPNTFLKTTADG